MKPDDIREFARGLLSKLYAEALVSFKRILLYRKWADQHLFSAMAILAKA